MRAPYISPVMTLCLAPAGMFSAAPAAVAQTLRPESFRIDAPEADVRIDFARLVETGVWDEVERSLLRAALAMVEKEVGCEIGKLTDFRLWVRVPQEEGARRSRVQRVFVTRGDIGWPTWTEGWEAEAIGDHAARSRDPSAFLLRVGDDLQVYGARSLIEPIVRGEAEPGLPCPDQMSLLAGRQPALMHLYADLVAARGSGGDFGFLTEVEYPEDDPAAHLALRLVTLPSENEDDEPRLELIAAVRHAKGAAGLKVTQDAAQKWLEELTNTPQMLGLKPVVAKIRFETSGTDYIARLPLGRTREAIGTVAQVVLPLMVVQVERANRALHAARAAEAAALKALLEARAKQPGGDK